MADVPNNDGKAKGADLFTPYESKVESDKPNTESPQVFNLDLFKPYNAGRDDNSVKPDVLPEVRVTDSGAGDKLADWKVAPSPYVSGEVFKQFAELGLAKDGWKPTNATQRRVLADANSTSLELDKLPKSLLDGKGSRGDVTPVNSFLERKGFDIKLRQIPEDGLAVAGTLTLEGEWKGENLQLRGKDGKDYPGFTKDAEVFEVNGKPVVKLFEHPEHNFEVFLSPVDNLPGGFDASKVAESLTPNADSKRLELERVHMPKVALDESSDLKELLGMAHKKWRLYIPSNSTDHIEY